MSKLQEAKQAAAEKLLSLNRPGNVVGVGIGKKSVKGQPTSIDCLRIYVVSKLDRGHVRPAELVPQDFLGIPTDVIQIGPLGRMGRTPKPRGDDIPVHSGQGHFQPPRPGSPIRADTVAPNVNSGARGTLGMVVADGNQRHILSCNHILAVNGRVLEDRKANVVSAEFVNKEEPIAKPGVFVPLSRDGDNFVDCALAQIKEVDNVDAAFPSRVGKLNTPDPIPPECDMEVQKLGAATGATEGTIVDISADLYVNYDFGTFRFANQVVIDGGRDDEEFATEGDSGSVVWDQKAKQAVAMVFAASGRYAVACPLPKVLDLLKARIPKGANRYATLKLVI